MRVVVILEAETWHDYIRAETTLSVLHLLTLFVHCQCPDTVFYCGQHHVGHTFCL